MAIVDDLNLSDHRAISLTWEFERKPKGYPFKFNRSWLEDESFNTLIKNQLKLYQRQAGVSAMDHLTNTMKEIKKVVQLWEKGKIWETNDRIRNI